MTWEQGTKQARQDDWAICCSGGGIRSASFCLGALQELQRGGLLKRARWILGVSGGGYIAASRALVAHHLRELAPADGTAAYAPGSAEERNLRNNTHYIAPDGTTVLVGVLSLFLGTIVTALMVFAPLFAAAHAWGWLLHGAAALTPSGAALGLSVAPWMWLVPGAAGLVTLMLFAWWWWTLPPPRSVAPAGRLGRLWALPTLHDPDRGSGNAHWVGWSALITAVLAVLTLGLPAAAYWLFGSGGAVGTVAHFFGFGHHLTVSWAALAGLAAAIAAIARSCQAGLAKWNKLAGQKATPSADTAVTEGMVAKVASTLRQRLLPWLASAVIVLVAVLAAVAWTGDGAMAGVTAGQVWAVLVAIAVMVATRVLADVNRMSMHDFYRWRLANAYAVSRQAIREQNPALRRQKFAEAAATPLSDLHGAVEDYPELVLCATANVNASRETPSGQNGFCLTFDPEHVTLHRELGSTERDRAQADTRDYEALVGHERFTLFDLSAIAGAAISPLMGSATREAQRILLTVANVRLGVWLPHPRVVAAAGAFLDARPGDAWWERRPLLLLLWYLSPHPLWDQAPDRNAGREALLWAHVLRLRRPQRESWARRVRAALWYHALQPTLGLLWAEAVGHTSYRSTWVCASDGGHYDNLGLVEALRRGARHIVVLDASGDKAHSWSTLGGAIALARADAGVEIDLGPMSMISDNEQVVAGLAPGEVVHPWAHGTFTLPENGHQVRKGDIWVCKLGWWRGAPWDVRSYATGHKEYPCRSTTDQLYDGAEFEAYRELGAAAVLAAAHEGGMFLPDGPPRVTRPPAPEGSRR
jgi:hypothetical protein